MCTRQASSCTPAKPALALDGGVSSRLHSRLTPTAGVSCVGREWSRRCGAISGSRRSVRVSDGARSTNTDADKEQREAHLREQRHCLEVRMFPCDSLEAAAPATTRAEQQAGV